MPTDRELDRAVAEALGDVRDSKDPTGRRWICPNGDTYSCHDGGPRHYSIFLPAAWVCVDFIAEKFGFRSMNGFTLVRKDESGKPAFWYCEAGDPVWESGEGKTPAEAICRWFLTTLREGGQGDAGGE